MCRVWQCRRNEDPRMLTPCISKFKVTSGSDNISNRCTTEELDGSLKQTFYVDDDINGICMVVFIYYSVLTMSKFL